MAPFPQAIQHCRRWFKDQGWTPFAFQLQAWSAYLSGGQGLVNAPTGSGKTYSLLLPAIAEGIERAKADPKSTEGGQIIWITPIRALAKEIEQSAQRAVQALGSDWTVGIRTGDTSQKVKQDQKKKLPHILITTPESVHVILASKGYAKLFRNLQAVVIDEWHELMGSKRAVQCELFLSRLRAMRPEMRTWGISATIGNMEESMDILLGMEPLQPGQIIRADIEKKLVVEPVLPDEVETLPWAGHLGIKLLEKVVPLIHENNSTLIFTNTRAQAEIWFQKLLEVDPSLAGVLAMHHSAIGKEVRAWVEEALYDGRLKAVVCTSSLDLGVDFRPVDCVVQIGSPKGVSRFVQRAGRSGHRPGATSIIHFVPTHSLELIECAALRKAIERKTNEDRMPYLRSVDVLVQYMVTLAVSDGFDANALLREVRQTVSYGSISDEEWQWCLAFITNGGDALQSYDDFKRVELDEDGRYKVLSRKVAMRHRFNIGTIVSSTLVKVKLRRGKFLGQVEEYFVSKLSPGDAFWFAGQCLELVRFKGVEATVQPSRQKKGAVPSFMGGRMPLSAELGHYLRDKLEEASTGSSWADVELALIQPIIRLQKERSIVPARDQFLMEYLVDKEGHHLFVYPFEGRLVHEGLASLLSYRLGLFAPQTFSIAMNDYGFELLSDQPIPIGDALDSDIFTIKDLRQDLVSSLNESEMMQRRFRDIAQISGLVFTGYPGKNITTKQLQNSTRLMYEVFRDYDPDNLLLRQSYEEVHEFQLEEARMRAALDRISSQEHRLVHLDKPSPLSFPILVDRLRETMASESLAERIKRMQLDFG
jgi:ATP-dependent Lhr-like helicase